MSDDILVGAAAEEQGSSLRLTRHGRLSGLGVLFQRLGCPAATIEAPPECPHPGDPAPASLHPGRRSRQQRACSLVLLVSVHQGSSTSCRALAAQPAWCGGTSPSSRRSSGLAGRSTANRVPCWASPNSCTSAPRAARNWAEPRPTIRSDGTGTGQVPLPRSASTEALSCFSALSLRASAGTSG